MINSNFWLGLYILICNIPGIYFIFFIHFNAVYVIRHPFNKKKIFYHSRIRQNFFTAVTYRQTNTKKRKGWTLVDCETKKKKYFAFFIHKIYIFIKVLQII